MQEEQAVQGRKITKKWKKKNLRDYCRSSKFLPPPTLWYGLVVAACEVSSRRRWFSSPDQPGMESTLYSVLDNFAARR